MKLPIRIYLPFYYMAFILMSNLVGIQKVQAQQWIDYVDPLTGTGASTVPSASRHGSGTEGLAQTYPAVGEPFAMTFWTPQTRISVAKCVSPYYYEDTVLNGFRASHWMSGSCTQDYGSMSLMPVSGDLLTQPDQFSTPFSHDNENASPDLYSLSLPDPQIDAKLTAANHAGILEFTFQSADTAWILAYPNFRDGKGWVKIIPERNEIIGYSPVQRIYQGWGQDGGFKGYFVIQFDQPFSYYGTWEEQTQHRQELVSSHNGWMGAYVGYPASSGQTIRAKVGMSFTNIEQAYRNLEAEIPDWDFDKVHNQTRQKWNDHLGKIRVSGGSENDKTTFYTALYHCMLLPRQFSDVEGTYRGFADDTTLYRQADYTYYADFSMWDTYRAVHPLYNLIFPDRSRDMMQSLVDKATQGGWLPIFPCWNNYTAAMIGDHVIACLTDAYVKGIDDFDIEQAYTYMRQNALQTPTSQEDYLNGKGRRALTSYLKYGYIPLEDSVMEAFHKREQVSRTLEYAYDDFCLSQIADVLGKTEDYELFQKRALNYRLIFDPQTGFMRGKYQDGSWYEPFDPSKKLFMYTEGTAWQYSWYVPHDVGGLIALHGGNQAFCNKLDSVFSQQHYWHGNEPSHHIAFLYDYADQPWKTQYHVRNILREEYGTGPGGLSGNDDAGQMSAWYVFAAMGMYPVCPGKPEYALSSPLFDKIEIDTKEGKTFTITSSGGTTADFYITSARIDGELLEKSLIDHQYILEGAHLELTLGEKPGGIK